MANKVLQFLRRFFGDGISWIGDNVVAEAVIRPVVNGARVQVTAKVVGRAAPRHDLIRLKEDLSILKREGFPLTNLRRGLRGTADRPEDEIHLYVCLAAYGEINDPEERPGQEKLKRKLTPHEVLKVLDEDAADPETWEEFLNLMDQDNPSRLGRLWTHFNERGNAWAEAYEAETDKKYRRGW